MAFFRPLFLWGLLFLAVPIIIHFFQRRRTIRFDFSSIRFLKDAAVKASRRKQLRRLLLLLSRIAIAIALILLFAQPYDRNDPFGVFRNPQGRTFVWVDPTISMDYRQDGEALWEQADRGVWVLDSMLPKSHKLFMFDNCRNEFVERRGAQHGECAATRHGETNLAAALRAFGRVRHRGPHLPGLVLFGDFQRRDAPIVDTFLLTDTIFYPVVFVWLAPRHAYNHSVSVVSPPTTQNPYLECRVNSVGRDLPSGDLSVLSGSLRTGHERIACTRDDSVRISVETSAQAQAQPGAVRLDADDPFQHDNVDYFVAESGQAVRVLVVCEDEAAFPIAAALNSLGELYEPVTVRAHEVEFESLDSADVIILSSVAQPTRSLHALFARRSLEKKVIVFSPNMSQEHSSLNGDVMGHLGATSNVEKKRADPPLFPVLPDTVSTLWRGFPRQQDRSVAIDEYLASIPGNVLLRLSNREALATYAVDSAGHCWIVLAAALGIDESNNLAETGFYVPFVDRILRFGLSAVHKHTQAWVAGYAQRNPFFGEGRSAQVYDSEGRLLAKWGGQPTVGFESPGVYKVRPRDEAAYWVAVRSATDEGELVYRRPEASGEKKRYVKVMGEKAFEEFLDSLRGSSRLNILWIVLGILLVVELLLWQWKRVE